MNPQHRSDNSEMSVVRDEVLCEQPLLTVDRQMGLSIVHPEGKVCLFIFPVLYVLVRLRHGPCNSLLRRGLNVCVMIRSPIRASCTVSVSFYDDCVIAYSLSGSRSSAHRPLCVPGFFIFDRHKGDRCINFFVAIAHQIRVHLQYLGHPIANDPIYSETKIWVCASRPVCAAEELVYEDHFVGSCVG